jgi:hypothetical protein
MDDVGHRRVEITRPLTMYLGENGTSFLAQHDLQYSTKFHTILNSFQMSLLYGLPLA